MKNKLKKLVIFSLTMLLLISVFSVTSSAVVGNFNGSSSGSSTATAQNATGGYSIQYAGNSAYKCIIGYRFSIYDVDTRQKLTKSSVCDIYNDDWDAYYNLKYTQLHTNQFQLTKLNYIERYQNGKGNYTMNTDSTTPSSASPKFNYVNAKNCGFSSAMPQNPANLKSWIETGKNNDIIYDKCGYNPVTNSVTPNMKLVAEPIFQVTMAGQKHALTATEMAFLGGCIKKDFSYNKNENAKDIDFINNYVCRVFPNLLIHTANIAAPNNQTMYAATTISGTNRETYHNIISKGYGVGIFTPKVTSSTVEYKYRLKDVDDTKTTVQNGASITLASQPIASALKSAQLLPTTNFW